MVITKSVVENVKSHFSCQNMTGGELEDQGASATVGTHWERRVFGDEVFC